VSWSWWSETTWTEIQLLGIALLCSAIVGIERQFHHKSAGMRTHVLVALGSAAFTLVSAFGFAGVLGTNVTFDPSRIAAQVVSGVGFLGAGVIFMRRDIVRGLTTAASIWVVAAIGMASGAGMPTLAVALTIAHLLVVAVLAPLSRLLPAHDRGRVVQITYRDGQGILREVLREVGEMGSSFTVLGTTTQESLQEPTAMITLELRHGPALGDLIVAMAEVPGVIDVRRGTSPDDD
jgi:putative Mg2+ transporter-C (MgtC) family protein